MQTFRPEHVDLDNANGSAALGNGDGGMAVPVTRSQLQLSASDGGLRTGVWDSRAGTRDYHFTCDEWAYILEGEAHVTAGGVTHTLRAGDVFYTPAGMPMTWVVPEYVRKVWVHRRPPLHTRIARKARRVAARWRTTGGRAVAFGTAALAEPLGLVEPALSMLLA
jgi:uncharacterized cupin superfamily protein